MRTILAISAHPDDESLFCGGTLARYAQLGHHVFILNPDDPADIVADISPWHDVKVAAVLCHQTQHTMFLRNTGAAAVEDMTWKTESFHIWQGSVPDELR
jgi:LmbE family N-acetylglucosaminyl deacetylase